jgi:DNA-binding MarR family transcriptional regulator
MAENWRGYILKGRSREKIITFLLDKPYTFTELLGLTGYSRSTLTSHLKALQGDKVIEKKLDEDDGAVFSLTLDSDRLLLEMKSFAFETVMAYLNTFQPQVGVLMRVVVKAAIKTRLQYDSSRLKGGAMLPKDLTEFLSNLNESLTPEDIEVLGLEDGVKLSDYFVPYFKEKGEALIDSVDEEASSRR